MKSSMPAPSRIKTSSRRVTLGMIAAVKKEAPDLILINRDFVIKDPSSLSELCTKLRALSATDGTALLAIFSATWKMRASTTSRTTAPISPSRASASSFPDLTPSGANTLIPPAPSGAIEKTTPSSPSSTNPTSLTSFTPSGREFDCDAIIAARYPSPNQSSFRISNSRI